MIAPRHRILVPTASLLSLGFLVLAVAWPAGTYEHFLIGLLLGTMFGLTTVAAAWCALGPWLLILRLPLSVAWVSLIVVVFTLNVALHRGGYEPALPLAACLFGQWLLTQIPLWGLALAYGWRLRPLEEASQPVDPRQRQFGIGQLMIFTAIVAVVFGIGRAVVLTLAKDQRSSGDLMILAFLGVAAVVITLPLVLASLLPRSTAVPAVLGALAFISVATSLELSLLTPLQAAGIVPADVVWTNVFTTAWVLAFLVAVRKSSYVLR